MVKQLYALIGAGLVLAASQVQAQEQGASTSLSIELNGTAASERGCRLTFVAMNGLETDIARAAFEVALFGKDGVVTRLTVLDFKELPQSRTKVRQFDLPDLDCKDLGRVLINGSTACEGPEAAACMASLETAARGDVGFGK